MRHTEKARRKVLSARPAYHRRIRRKQTRGCARVYTISASRTLPTRCCALFRLLLAVSPIRRVWAGYADHVDEKNFFETFFLAFWCSHISCLPSGPVAVQLRPPSPLSAPPTMCAADIFRSSRSNTHTPPKHRSKQNFGRVKPFMTSEGRCRGRRYHCHKKRSPRTPVKPRNTK